MKIITFLSLIVFSSVFSNANIVPDEFYVTQRDPYAAYFDIDSTYYKHGFVYRTPWTWTKEYDFYDNEGRLDARAILSGNWVNELPTFEVVDMHHTILGRIEKKNYWFTVAYDIFSASRQTVALATLNFWSTAYSITDPVTGIEFAKLSRPYWGFSGRWTINITDRILWNAKQIDPRLFVTLVIYQSDQENAERIRREQELRKPVKVIAKLETLKKLKDFHKSFNFIPPTEDDFVKLTSLVDSFNPKNKEEVVESLFSLMDNQLTDQEKSALCLLIERLS